MKVARFVSVVSFITCFCLLYVYQQTEIFRLGYLGQKKLVNMEYLLEKNNLLRYNIKSNTSLAYIGDKVSGSAEFQMPDSYHLVRLTPSGQRATINQNTARRETLLSRIFGVKRQAEARTINP